MASESYDGDRSQEQLPLAMGPIWPDNLEVAPDGQVKAHVRHPVDGRACQLTSANTLLFFDDRVGAPSQGIVYAQAEQSFLYDITSTRNFDFKLGTDSLRHQRLMEVIIPDVVAYAHDYRDKDPGLFGDDPEAVDQVLPRFNMLVSFELARMTAEYITAHQENYSPVILDEILLSRRDQQFISTPVNRPQAKAATRLTYTYMGQLMDSPLSLHLGDHFEQCLSDCNQQEAVSRSVQAVKASLDDYTATGLAHKFPSADSGDIKKLATVGARQVFGQLLVDLNRQLATEPDLLDRLDPSAIPDFIRHFIWHNQAHLHQLQYPILQLACQEAVEAASGYFTGWYKPAGRPNQVSAQEQIGLLARHRHVYELSADLFETLLANQFPYKHNGCTMVAKAA